MEIVENVEIIEFMKCVDTAVEISEIINIIEITRMFGILTPRIMESNKKQSMKILKVKIRLAKNVGKVVIGRNISRPLVESFHRIFHWLDHSYYFMGIEGVFYHI